MKYRPVFQRTSQLVARELPPYVTQRVGEEKEEILIIRWMEECHPVLGGVRVTHMVGEKLVFIQVNVLYESNVLKHCLHLRNHHHLNEWSFYDSNNLVETPAMHVTCF